MNLNETLRGIIGTGASMLVGALLLLLTYRAGVYAIHRIVPTVIKAQAAHLPSGQSSEDEVAKRIRTIEDLLLRLLRMGVLAGFVVGALAILEWWTILAAIVLVIVAVVVATRDVVLDYVMGFLILLEGPFFKDDYIAISGYPGIEGVVEEIGLRRTLLRDAVGASHAVSNGFVRMPSNLTRLFSVAVVEFHVPRAGDLEKALEAASKVSDEMRADAAWAAMFAADALTDIWVTGIGIDGAAIRIQQRVPTGAQGPVASELRRRLAAALVEGSVGTGRWDTPMPIVSRPTGQP